MIIAFYKTRRGTHSIRTIPTEEEALKILKGGYNTLEVELRDGEEIVGERYRLDNYEREEFGRKWGFWYDTDAIRND